MVSLHAVIALGLAALYVGLFIILIRHPQNFFETPLWCLYVPLLAVIMAFWGFTERANWATIVGAVARGLITLEAIGLLLFNSPQPGLRWVACLGFGFGAGWLFDSTVGLSWLGQARVGCFVALLVAVFLWRWSNYGAFPLFWGHSVFMLMWLGSSVLASAMGSRRGDTWDIAAMLIQAETLVCWMWLCSKRQSLQPSPHAG